MRDLVSSKHRKLHMDNNELSRLLLLLFFFFRKETEFIKQRKDTKKSGLNELFHSPEDANALLVQNDQILEIIKILCYGKRNPDIK